MRVPEPGRGAAGDKDAAPPERMVQFHEEIKQAGIEQQLIQVPGRGFEKE